MALINIALNANKDHAKRMNGLLRLDKMNRVVKLAAMGDDGLSYKHAEDENRMIVGFKNNVVIDFRNGEVREGRYDDYIFKVVPYDYDPNQMIPRRFISFLKNTFAYPELKPRREFNKKHKNYDELLKQHIQECKEWYRKKKEYVDSMLRFIQVLLGYILMGTGKERKFIIFWGPDGNNGKTTLMNIICAIFGEYAVSIDPNILLSKKIDISAGSHSSHILDWQDRRWLFADETESGKKLDVGFIKRVTGNGSLVARGAHEKELVRFVQTFTIILLTNSLPYIPVDDEPSWRRTLIVPFLWSFVENPAKPNQRLIDKNLLDDLKDEYPAIIKWIVDGAWIYKEQNCLDVPKCVKDKTQEYRDESDPYMQFANECLCRDYDCVIRASSMYNVYKAWCYNNNQKAVKIRRFVEQMTRLGYERTRRNKGWIYTDVYFNEDALKDLFPDSEKRNDVQQDANTSEDELTPGLSKMSQDGDATEDPFSL